MATFGLQLSSRIENEDFTRMTTKDARAFLDVASALVGLDIQPEWKPNVASFLEMAGRMAEAIDATGASTSVEAAPIFTPRAVE